MDTFTKIYDIAKETGLSFPYIGNVVHDDYENTKCPQCGQVCIKRVGYTIDIGGLVDFKCKNCGNIMPIISKYYKKQNI